MLPETPQRLQREVDMHIHLGSITACHQGYAAPEVGEIYTSARQLCHHLEDPQRFSQCYVVCGIILTCAGTRRRSPWARAAPDSGAAHPGPCHARGGAPCLGGDIALLRRSNHGATHCARG